MPGIIKVKIIEARDLPIMDRASDLTDAFVELRLGTTVFKTEVYRKSLNPHWDSEWYKFEVDDEELQEEYLQLKVLDHDTYSSHDMIGKVNIILDTLVSNADSKELNALFPIYDTLNGIRGFIRVKVRAQFFNDMNKYRQTSCGVNFYSAAGIPSGYVSSEIHGLVNELLVNDDPEYQWIDKIRTPRASNEARQRLFTKMSGEVKRKIGLKVIEMGGNAVVGYQQYFDLEGETGIVIRGIGTSVTLIKENEGCSGNILSPTSNDDQYVRLTNGENGINQRISHQQHVFVRGISISSDTDNKPTDSPDISYLNRQPFLARKKTCVEDLEFPFFTLCSPPNGFILHLGGMVSSRSVKLLDKINNPEEPETREMWWTEIRTEIRSHAKAMGCDAVLGYTEHTAICDDLIILSAYGTAAVIKQSLIKEHSLEANERRDTLVDSAFEGFNESYENKRGSRVDSFNDSLSLTSSQPENAVFDNDVNSPGCTMCHIPYSEIDVQIPISLSKCSFCRQDKVPEILLATIDIPEDIPITGTGCMIDARVVRIKKKEKDEANAENISQILPFLEFDLHQQLVNKLKLKGMNGIFGITSKLSIGEQTIIGAMVGTAVYLTALPQPPLLFVAGRKDNNVEDGNEKIVEIQKRLLEVTKKNQMFFHLKDMDDSNTMKGNNHTSSYNEDHVHVKEDPRSGKLDLQSDYKETYLLEVDELDVNNVGSLLSYDNIEGISIFNTQATPGYPALHQDYKFISMFKSWRIPSVSQEDYPKLNQWLTSLCDIMKMSLRIKVQKMMPCCLTNLYHNIKITDEEYLQITLNTFVCRVDERYQKTKAALSRRYSRSESSHSGGANRSIEAENEHDEVKYVGQQTLAKSIEKINKKNQQISRFQPPVIISSLDHIPNSQTIQYLGNINLFLIRESTDVKEDGGLNLFMQKFMNEIHAIVRAHVLFLGGNAILSFFVNEITLYCNPHKNQTQCLVNISGDAAEVKVLPLDHCLANELEQISSSSSVGQSPSANQSTEAAEEIKYKLERSVYGTCV